MADDADVVQAAGGELWRRHQNTFRRPHADPLFDAAQSHDAAGDVRVPVDGRLQSLSLELVRVVDDRNVEVSVDDHRHGLAGSQLPAVVAVYRGPIQAVSSDQARALLLLALPSGVVPRWALVEVFLQRRASACIARGPAPRAATTSCRLQASASDRRHIRTGAARHPR